MMLPRYTYLLLLWALLLVSCRSSMQQASVYSESYVIADTTARVADEMTTLIQPYKGQLDDKMNEVIAHVAIALQKGRPESSLGNWVADLIYEQSRRRNEDVDFALQNAGGLRLPGLPEGDLPRKKIYELMPFDNELVVMELSADMVQQLFDHMAQKGGWPISKQVRYRISSAGKATDIFINERPLNKQRTYIVALPDYVAYGGSDSGFLKPIPKQKLGVKLRDVMLLHVEELTANGQSIEAKLDGRVKR